MAVRTLLYGSRCWNLTKEENSRTEADEMRFLRDVAGHERADRIRNREIRHELNMFNILDTTAS
jgi:hypothetical protein